MNRLFRIAIAGALCVGVTSAHAYGSGPSSGHCEKPVFSEFQPATNKYIQSLSEFSMVASSNTTPTSIEVNVSAGQNKYHFSHKELEIKPEANGRLGISGKLPRPLGHGFVRISVTAHSKPGCEKTDGYLVRIQ